MPAPRRVDEAALCERVQQIMKLLNQRIMNPPGNAATAVPVPQTVVPARRSRKQKAPARVAPQDEPAAKKSKAVPRHRAPEAPTGLQLLASAAAVFGSQPSIGSSPAGAGLPSGQDESAAPIGLPPTLPQPTPVPSQNAPAFSQPARVPAVAPSVQSEAVAPATLPADLPAALPTLEAVEESSSAPPSSPTPVPLGKAAETLPAARAVPETHPPVSSDSEEEIDVVGLDDVDVPSPPAEDKKDAHFYFRHRYSIYKDMTSGLATVYRHPRAARGKKAECRPKDADVFVHFLHTTGKRTLPIIMNGSKLDLVQMEVAWNQKYPTMRVPEAEEVLWKCLCRRSWGDSCRPEGAAPSQKNTMTQERLLQVIEANASSVPPEPVPHVPRLVPEVFRSYLEENELLQEKSMNN